MTHCDTTSSIRYVSVLPTAVLRYFFMSRLLSFSTCYLGIRSKGAYWLKLPTKDNLQKENKSSAPSVLYSEVPCIQQKSMSCT